MNKFCLALILALSFGFYPSTLAVDKGPKLVTCKVGDKGLRSVKYRVGEMERSTLNGSPILLLPISVEPENINREALLLLARHLNQRFCREERLTVPILIDNKAAKHFNPNFQDVRDAWRGEYFLDRRTGEEYVSFTEVPDYNGHPKIHIRIDIR